MDRQKLRRSESGFSLVELLVAAFIMAVGLLGLAALENVAIKSSARSRGYNTAVLVASRVLDAAETQSRQSQQAASFGGGSTFTPDYFGTNPVVEQFTFKGQHPDATAPALIDQTPYFTATTSSANAGNYSGAVGKLAIVTTVVTFKEATYQGGPTVTRTITLSRTINHA